MTRPRLVHFFIIVDSDPFDEAKVALIKSLEERDYICEVRFDLGPEPGEGLQGFQVVYTGHVNEGIGLIADFCNIIGLEINTIGVF